MNAADVQSFLDISRRKTLELLDNIAKRPDAAAILGWRPGPGRAHIGWQLMHIAATDDRHLNVRMHPGQPREPEYVRRFAGGSTPDEEVPSLDTIRSYLTDRRSDMLAHLRSLSAEQLEKKPTPDAPWAYAEWFQVLTWHEAHHQGQAHLTLNLYKAAHPM
jgi:uncharacterized damage-inducible protein DinB